MAIIKKYQAEITEIINRGEGVFTLELNSLGRKFKFTPGQFLHLALDEYDPSEGWPESRCFSMQTPPNNKKIKITYAVKGDFTNKMVNNLHKGSIVQLKMPYGNLFNREHKKDNTIFIAGGTGITPFLSLFNDESFTEYVNPELYLGLRSENYNFYTEELDKAFKVNPSLKINIINQVSDGFINVSNILNENYKNTSFFISGPPEMIKSFKKTLIGNGVKEVDVLTDDWE